MSLHTGAPPDKDGVVFLSEIPSLPSWRVTHPIMTDSLQVHEKTMGAAP
jgi:hypothetical protein